MAARDNDAPDQTLADYVGILIGPLLVMTLVGSLAFFLLEVCYVGDYVGRMRWTLFFFVMGIVLVNRIAMLPDISDRSWMYGVVLAGGTWLCLQGLVEYPHGSLIRELSPVINLGIIGVIWWSSGKLVRDCTNIDEDTDMSGEGLLRVAGMEDARDKEKDQTAPAPPEPEPTTAKGLVSWWERYQRYRAEQDKKRTLGVWVIYFSLAALPLFGLGQTLIPPSESERRLASFFLLGIYVASGLGLLMTTCFLSLRRYLRQRRLKMPTSMAAVWLTCGLILIVTLLGIGAFLPRPSAEFAVVNWQTLTGGEKKASQASLLKDSPGKGESGSRSSTAKNDPNSQNSGSNDEKGKGSGNQQSNGSGQQKSQGDSGNQKQDGNKGSGDKKGKDGGGEKEARKEPGQKKDDGGKESSGGTSKPSSEKGDGKDQKSDSQSERSSSTDSTVASLAKVFKWVVFAVVGVVTVCVVLFAIVRFLANFTDWAARWMAAWSRFWNRLFGQRVRKEEEAELTERRVPARPPRPFSSYHNPFRLGQRWTPYEFCCYTFAAFEAWARERGVPRDAGETPLEHAERVGNEVPDMEADARKLALIYARGVYGGGDLPAAVNAVLEQIWEHLETGERVSV